jgi:hypothetical protein
MTKIRSETSAKSAGEVLSPALFSELSKQQLGSLLAMQKEFFEASQEMNRAWSERTELGAAIVSQFLAKLAEEGRRLYDDSGKLMTKSARLFPNGYNTSP